MWAYLFSVGPRAAPIINTTFTTIDSITLTWTPIPCGQQAGEITHYQYLLYKPGTTAPIQVHNDTNSLTATFNNLEPCTRYSITALAFNINGSASRNETVTTPSIGKIDHFN